MNKRIIITACLLVSAWTTTCAAKTISPVPTPQQLAWQQMEQYAFLHFSINTYTDQEWGFGNEAASLFNPQHLDARQWVRTCQAAGMKGIILTAKHHCGFCLWPTATTAYSVKASPWRGGKGDVVRELADACRKEGMKFAVYVSPWDRNAGSYGTPEYIGMFREQLRELLTGYGDVFEVWLDGANGGTGWYDGADERRQIDRHTYYDWAETYRLIRGWQPDCMIWNDGGLRGDLRWTGTEAGYVGQPNWSMLMAEGDVPREQLHHGVENGDRWVPAEVNTSIRPGWFWHERENGKVKTLAQLIDTYYKSVGRNGTLLLNFPITPDGLIDRPDSITAAAFGQYIKTLFANDLAAGSRQEALPPTASDKGGILLTLQRPTQVNRILVGERIEEGQRVRAFRLEAEVNGQWIELHDELLPDGTPLSTIGYKRIVCFPTVTADKVRVTILETRDNQPAMLKNISLYLAPDIVEPTLPSPAAQTSTRDVSVEQGRFEANWESLAAWECPAWFKDAKFGIWAHWGPQCQAEDGDWYARFMYYPGSGQYNWHASHFGSPSEYGLKELIRDWKAEAWNPEELVALYKSVGARYFFTLGQHHDNFDLWNSPYQEWNSVNLGPQRDIVGEWAAACKKYGLPLGVSMHGSHTWTWMEPSQAFDGNLTKEDGTGTWWEGYDPQELYAQRHAHSTGWENSGSIHGQWNWGNGASQPSEAYKRKFQNRVLQCINDYQPAMLYFDDTVLPFYGCDDQVGLNILQHYYNKNVREDGTSPVVVMGKILEEQHKRAMLWDVERGTPDRIQDEYWQTCTCIGEWHYNQAVYNQNRYKSAQQVVDMLIDIVAKNGNLLLSIPLKGDGTIDSREREVLAGIKEWMDQNGESIYGTRPWKTFGEGPLAEAVNPMTAQGFNEKNNYSARDVRYVQRQDSLYATIMRWPEAGAFTFKALGLTSPHYSGKVKAVKLLGHGNMAFSQTPDGLEVTVPATPVNKIAPVFLITFDAAADTQLP